MSVAGIIVTILVILIFLLPILFGSKIHKIEEKIINKFKKKDKETK